MSLKNLGMGGLIRFICYGLIVIDALVVDPIYGSSKRVLHPTLEEQHSGIKNMVAEIALA